MDKNTIIGMVLIAALLFGYSWYSQPSAEEQRAAFVQDSIAQAKRENSKRRKRPMPPPTSKPNSNRRLPTPQHSSMRPCRERNSGWC